MTSAFSTEPFPTYVRSRASAWCRNAFEIPGGVLGALVVGLLGDHVSGPVGSIGDWTFEVGKVTQTLMEDYSNFVRGKYKI